MPPELSILLPVRDARATLKACLQSIRCQTFPDWELLLVNDHSRDGSVELAAHAATQDSRICITHNPGDGLVDALNHGLEQCRSEWVVRMDADDLMLPLRLEQHLAHVRANPELALSATRVRLFGEQPIQAGYRAYMQWQNQCTTWDEISAQIYIESPFAHPSVMFRKSVVVALGGYRKGLFPEDYDLWLRLFHSGQRMEKIPEVLLDWREHDRRVSRTDPRCSRESFDRLRAEYLARDPRLLRQRHDFTIWGAGRKTRRRCDHLLSHGFAPRAWIDIDEKKIGNRIAGIPVVDSGWLVQAGMPFVLVYVTNHGAREEIMDELLQLGYQPGRDCLAVG